MPSEIRNTILGKGSQGGAGAWRLESERRLEMKISDFYNAMINASHEDGRKALRDEGFVYTAPVRIGSGYTSASAYGIIDGYYQMWVYRYATRDRTGGQWVLTHSWEAVPGRLYGRPEAQVGV